ncbi:MAG: hypothetical protein OXD54_03650 [Candidatus Poribacteria bacterium]|nr:hypothetical protein [Candidatus Poribacteria bacterium]
MSIGTTTTEMSSCELAKRRENLRNQWENRQVDEELLKRAWEAAHSVATVLYEDYGASKVAVFGSLAERDWFVQESDIDIAVWGISDGQNLRTICQKEGFDNKHFKFDLIDYDGVNDYFRNRVSQQTIPINKGEKYDYNIFDKIYSTIEENENKYEKYKSRLIQYVEDGHHNIDDNFDGIMKKLRKIEVNTIKVDNNIIDCLAYRVATVYHCIANILKHIARMVDMCVPAYWDSSDELLTQIAEQKATRPRVLTHETISRLNPLLKHRNDYNNSVTFVFEDVKKLGMQLKELVPIVFIELDTFVAFLSET